MTNGQNKATRTTPFLLTYGPKHVVKHMTTSVYVRCAHEGHRASQLSHISMIRMYKKSKTASRWKPVAEIRDNEPTPKAYIGVSVTASINPIIRKSYIQIVWKVASTDTYGLYRCDFIGFDKNTFDSLAEVTPVVSLVEESVTTIDMLQMFLETKKELRDIVDDERHIKDGVESLDANITSIEKQVDNQGKGVTGLENDMDTIQQSLNLATGDTALLKGEVSSLKYKSSSVKENARKIDYLDSAIESMRSEIDSDWSQLDNLMSWPAGRFALLQPKSGCPVDLTFFGGNTKYWQIHTESSSNTINRNAHSDAFLPWTLSTVNGNNFATLKFCEANGILNTGSWPSGSYCINRLFGFSCPSGFREGEIQLDVEDTSPIIEYTSGSVVGGHSILFCCKSSGDVSTSIVLPTQSPFLLYRRGGQCQQVRGMNVALQTIVIDTEDDVNGDHKVDNWPDVDMHQSGTVLQHYLHMDFVVVGNLDTGDDDYDDDDDDNGEDDYDDDDDDDDGDDVDGGGGGYGECYEEKK
ncbi:apextrin-like protein [Elysia marginata]|uniref:Apextrin-like protein n=1 Tax=Elysia marginata TaxID=1093978 RepID=A0AAV4JZZ4_9GAST|nr:apextrin-like protein [Elysia marginata]